MQSGFEKLGIETQYTNDVFSIDGKGSDFLLQEGQIDSFEDHRIAMSFVIAGLIILSYIQSLFKVVF